ncbi:MAG: hypothetical protein ACJAZ1_000966 [Yoonia sp.]|jgi:hypothetical protein
MLLEEAPPNIVSLVLRRRYIALAIAVNIPGNAAICGGGSIMMVAGLSGIIAPLPTLITVLIGVSPVPLEVYFFGA